jgi:glycine/D-amino acid oxidase-like deaminating enzyme
MNFRSAETHFLSPLNESRSFSTLRHSISTDVAVIGAGITGALVAYHLAKAGIKVVLLDRKQIGQGSTCASTALLQYEIDTPLHQLSDMVGKPHAETSYLLCRNAIHDLHRISQDLAVDTGFSLRKSLYYASSEADKVMLEKEFAARKAIGLNVEWLEAGQVKALFPFPAPAAILSHDAAQVDAYRLTWGLLQSAVENKARIFEQTGITGMAYQPGKVLLQTESGNTVTARKVVIASGYESARYIDKSLLQLNSSFVICSEPMAEEEFWYRNCLLWETARPYYYFRTTADRRIIVGGGDVKGFIPTQMEALVARKSAELLNEFHKKFNYLDFKIATQWGGAFAETEDGLPYIGSIEQYPDTYFALGFGGNGIIFSQIAAQLIRDSFLGKASADEAIFSFDRRK